MGFFRQLRAIAAFAVLIVFTTSVRADKIWSLSPSSWSALTNNTDYTAAELGFTAVSGTSALGVSNKVTYRTWSGAQLTVPEGTGGQFASLGTSKGGVVLGNYQTVTFMPTADGSVFGGTSGSYTGSATISMDIMFVCTDPAGLTQTNDSVVCDLGIGAAQAFRIRFTLSNHTGVNYKQRAGIKVYPFPSSGPTTIQRLNGLSSASTLEPELEFNKVYTISHQVTAGNSTTGGWRQWVNRSIVSSMVGYDTNGGATNLGAAANSFVIASYVGTGYTSGPTIQLVVLPRIRIDNGSTWHNELVNPAPASNVGTTRTFPAWTPRDSEDAGGFPLTITNVSGTPTATGTFYNSSGIGPRRHRIVFGSASAGNTVRISSVDQLGDLETDTSGNQFVGWCSEYIPTGSAVWGIRSGSDTSSYSIAVNFKDGLMREGSTAGSGTILFAADPSKIYGVCLNGNPTNGQARLTIINLTDEYNRAPLIRTVKLSTPWPTLPLGVMSATYVFGATAPEASGMIAGRTWGLMAGDSYGTAYINNFGTVTIGVTGGNSTALTTGHTITEATTGAVGTIVTATKTDGAAFTSGTTTAAQVISITATINNNSAQFIGGYGLTTSGSATATGTGVVFSNHLVSTYNNVGQHLAYGSEGHFIAEAFRPGKTTNPAIPDVTYQWSIGRSGRAIEYMGSTIDELGNIVGSCVMVPGFGYNSTPLINQSTASTTLANWGIQARRFRDRVLANANVLIWPSPPMKVGVNGFLNPGCETFFSGTYGELTRDRGTAPGKFYTCNTYPESYAFFVGDWGDVHILGGTEGARYYVSRLFGNPSGGIASGSLVAR